VPVRFSSAAASRAVMETISYPGDGLGAVRMLLTCAWPRAVPQHAHAVYGMHTMYR
jgi:hypothetical protein